MDMEVTVEQWRILRYYLTQDGEPYGYETKC